MRGRPEHIEAAEALIEDRLGDLPAPNCSIPRASTDVLVIHLRVSWVVERLQNAADAVAARDELTRRLRTPSPHPLIHGLGR